MYAQISPVNLRNILKIAPNLKKINLQSTILIELKLEGICFSEDVEIDLTDCVMSDELKKQFKKAIPHIEFPNDKAYETNSSLTLTNPSHHLDEYRDYQPAESKTFEFEKHRNEPVKYNRDLWQNTCNI